ncbi:hypothetical protein ACXYTP_20200 [Tsukamurella ocularis]|uniref:hypothetical protein n=1 Tax=Tsukamurella ocularis TaxID=1970234 RepID=UPI0039F0AD6F
MIDRPDTPHADVLLEGIWEDEVTPDDLASRALSAAQASSYAFRVASEGTTATAQLPDVDITEFLESETGKWAQSFIGIVRVGESLVHVSHALGELARSLQQVNLEQSEIVYQVEAEIEAAQRQSAQAGIDPAGRVAELIAAARARAAEVAEKMVTPEVSSSRAKPAAGLVSGFMAFGRVPGASAGAAERNGRVARNGHARNGYAIRNTRAEQNGHDAAPGHDAVGGPVETNGQDAAAGPVATNGHDTVTGPTAGEATVPAGKDAAAAAQDAFANSGDEPVMDLGFMGFGRTPSTAVPRAEETPSTADEPVADDHTEELATAADAADESDVGDVADGAATEAASDGDVPIVANGFLGLGSAPSMGVSADDAAMPVVPQALVNGFLAFGRTPGAGDAAAVQGPSSGPIPVAPPTQFLPIPTTPAEIAASAMGEAVGVELGAPLPPSGAADGPSSESDDVDAAAPDAGFLSFGRVPTGGAWGGSGVLPTVPTTTPGATSVDLNDGEADVDSDAEDDAPVEAADVDEAAEVADEAAERGDDGAAADTDGADETEAFDEDDADGGVTDLEDELAADDPVGAEVDFADEVDADEDVLLAPDEVEVDEDEVAEVEDVDDRTDEPAPDAGSEDADVEAVEEPRAEEPADDAADVAEEPAEDIDADASTEDSAAADADADEPVDADADAADDETAAAEASTDEPAAADAADDDIADDAVEDIAADAADAAAEEPAVEESPAATQGDELAGVDDPAEAEAVEAEVPPPAPVAAEKAAVAASRPVRKSGPVKFSDLLKAANANKVAPARMAPAAVVTAAEHPVAPVEAPSAEPEPAQPEPAQPEPAQVEPGGAPADEHAETEDTTPAAAAPPAAEEKPKAPAPVLATGPVILGRTEPLVLRKKVSPVVQQVHDAVASILGSLRGGPHGPESGLHWAAGLLVKDAETIMAVTTSDAGWLPPGVVIPAGVRVLWNVPGGYRWASIDDPVRLLIEYAEQDGYTLSAVATTHPSRAYASVVGEENLVRVLRPGAVLPGGRSRFEVTVSPARLQHIRSLDPEQAERQARALIRDLETQPIAPEHAIGIEAARIDARCFLDERDEVPPAVLEQLHTDERALGDALSLDRTPASAADLTAPAPESARLRDRMLERAILVATLAAAYHDIESAVYAWTFARFLSSQDQDSEQAR